MTGDYQQLWKSLTNATDKTVAVRILAEIVADREGRTFVMGLGSEAAKLCIETLDYVSCATRVCLSFVVSDSLVRVWWATTSDHAKRLLFSWP